MKSHIIFVLLLASLTACSFQNVGNNEPAIETKQKQDFVINELQKQKKITFTLDKFVYSTDEKLGITIDNNYYTTLFFGSDVIVQKYENQEWYSITLSHYGFTAEGYLLMPNKQHHDELFILKWLPAGEYRIIKEINLGDSPKSPKIDLISSQFTLN
jgi:hypothetical protein